MFRWLIGASLEFRIVVLGMAVALMLLGTFRIANMPVDILPEFEAPTVEIQTEALGLSAEEVESLITLNLEELLSGVPWLDSMRSESVTGLSSIVLKFKRGTDIIRARQMVQERLALAIYLPNVAQPPAMLQPTSATSRFMMIGVSSDEIDDIDLSMLARWTMKPKLTGVPGVANVSIWGQRLKQLQVQVDPRRLKDARVMQDDILTTAGDALWVSPLTFLKGSTPGTGGWIDNKNQRLGVLHTMPITTPEDMALVPVAPQHLLLKGQRMALGDIAEVTVDHPPLIGDAFVNDSAGLMLVVEKFPNANTLEVTAGVEQVLRELQRGLPGVKIDTTLFRLATYIEQGAENLGESIAIGALLATLALGALLFNWRAALVSVLSISLALTVGLLVMEATGMTLNAMVVAGLVLALGVVIDDVVVGVISLLDRLRREKPGDMRASAALILRATLESRTATVYGALIILLAIMPIFFMGGASGSFFRPLATSYVLAVIASLIVGLTVTPALSLMLLKASARGRSESSMVTVLGDVYVAVLDRLSGAPRLTVTVAAVLTIAGLATWATLDRSMLPALQEREVLVDLSTPPGTSHQETFRITSRISRELKTLPGVRSVGAHVGRAITGDQITGVNAAQIWVGIEEDADYEQTFAKVRETVGGYPGVDRTVGAYLRDTVSEALTGDANALVVRLYGHERETLNRKAEEVRQALSDVDGLVDLRAIGQVEEPQVKVHVDLAKASAANVKPGEVRRSSATVFSGLTVGFLYESQTIYDVVVWGTPESRRSVDDLRDVLVERSDRHHVRLGEVADVSVEAVPTVIRHDGIAPYVDVVADVVGRDLASVNDDVESRLASIEFPLEHYPQIRGEFIEREEAERRVLGLGLVAAIGIFLVLQACFRSWRLALIGFLVLPAAIAGGVVAMFTGSGAISLGSVIGLFAVLGLAARSSIQLITRYQHLEDGEEMPFGSELVVRGAREQLPSSLTSAVTIVVALLPVVAFGQVPGLEIVQPMAISIIGGIIATLLATLLVVPTLYLVLARGAERRGEDLGLAEEVV